MAGMPRVVGPQSFRPRVVSLLLREVPFRDLHGIDMLPFLHADILEQSRYAPVCGRGGISARAAGAGSGLTASVAAANSVPSL
eukprot:7379474-Prymnesium_polylepis.1